MRLLAATLCSSLCLAAAFAHAEINKGTHLNNSGQTKVNKALARGYMKSSADKDGYSAIQDKSQVNISSRRQGCTMNVGTTAKGQKAPKEVIVTSKEIINVCK